MHALVMILRRTWLATTLFVSVAVAIYWSWFSWDSAREAIVPTLVLSPITWWWLVGRRSRPGLLRGFLAGAVTGVVTQALPNLLPVLWRAHAPSGLGSGEQQAIGMVTVFLYLMVGAFSIPIGGLVGLVAVAIQKRTDKSASGSVAASNESRVAGNPARGLTPRR